VTAPPHALYTDPIFPGLRPFDADDALLFFGREEQTDELLRRLDDTRFLCIVGLSGCGKSSLVRAGLLPALRRGHLTDVGSQWRVCVMRPGADPLAALAHALDHTLGVRDRLEMLQSGDYGLLDASRFGRTADENLLLVVDQFEEIFRFQRTSDASRFVSLLLAASQEYESFYRLYVVITLRSDFLGECARFHGLPEALNESQYLVPRMTRSQLREAIEGPSALGGIHVAPEVVDELLDRTGDDPDQLPTLQHLLMRMSEKLDKNAPNPTITIREYIAVGGWDEALNRHAENEFHSLKDNEPALAKRIFQRLTARAPAGREVRRPADLRDLTDVANTTREAVQRMVEHFRRDGCNFLTSPDRDLTDDSVIDITHESLIRRWDRLRQWVDEEAESGEWYRRVEDRKRIVGAYLVDPELALAMRARDTGNWNPAWAKRYATEKQGVRFTYADINQFLDDSLARARSALSELRSSLTDLAYVEKKCRDGLIHELLAEYDAVLRSAGLGDDEWAQVAGFARFVRGESQLLVAHPELAFQQALNLPDSTAPAAAARRLASQDTRPRFRWVNKPQTPSPCVRTLFGHQDYVNGCDVALDGERIVSASSDTTLKIWDTATGHEIFTLHGHTSSVDACSFSSDGRRILSGARNGELKIWDAPSGSEMRALDGHRAAVVSCKFSRDAARAVSASLDGTVKVWQADTGVELHTLRSRADPVSCAFSLDGQWIVAGGKDGQLTIWDSWTGAELRTFGHHDKAITSCVWTPDGTSVLSASEDFTVRRWDVTTGDVTNTYGEDQQTVWALAISLDGRRLAGGAQDGSITFWDLETASTLARVTEHLGQVSALAFFPDGSRVLSGSWDAALKLWSVETAEKIHRELRAPTEGEDAARGGSWGYMICCGCSPDGRWLAAGSSDGVIRLWDAATGAAHGVFPVHRDFVMCCAFSPDSRWIVSGGWDGSLRLFDIVERREGPVATLPEMVFSCAFSRDGSRLVAGCARAVVIWDVDGDTIRERATWPATDRFVSCALSPDGDWVIAGLENGPFVVWDIDAEAQLRSFEGSPGVTCCALSTDGRRLATGSDPPALTIWDVAAGSRLLELTGHAARVVSCNFSPDGRRLVSGSWDQTLRVWDLNEPTDVTVVSGHADQLQDACFTADGHRLLSVAVDGTARLWDAATGTWLGSLLWPPDSTSVCTYSPDRRYVLTASHHHALKLWNGVTGQLERVVTGHQNAVRACDFSIQGRFVSASADATLKIWSVASAEPPYTLVGHAGPVQSCAFSPDGSGIVSGGWDKTVRLWNVERGEEVLVLRGHEDWVQIVLMAANGGLIVSCSHDKTVAIWDPATGARLHTLRGHDTAINAAALSPDGSRLVTGSEDGVLNVWDVRTGEAIARLAGHSGAIRDCAFADTIVSASQDGTLRIWDADGRSAPVILTSHNGPVLVCRISPDGRQLASGGSDQYVKLWDIASATLVAQYWAAAVVQSLAWQPASRRIAAGDAAGKIHLLEVEGTLP